MRSSLGRYDAENPVLERSLDIILVDARREAERAVEFAVGAFSHPISGFIALLRLSDLAGASGGRDLTVPAILLFVLDRDFLRLGLVAAGAVRGLAVDAAAHDQGVRVGEFNVDVFAVEAGQFAVQLVRALDFAHVEFGLEAAHGVAAGVGSVGVVIVQKTEDGRELGGGKAWEQRHGAGVVGVFQGIDGVWCEWGF